MVRNHPYGELLTHGWWNYKPEMDGELFTNGSYQPIPEKLAIG
jgi:hypothetical protein